MAIKNRQTYNTGFPKRFDDFVPDLVEESCRRDDLLELLLTEVCHVLDSEDEVF